MKPKHKGPWQPAKPTWRKRRGSRTNWKFHATIAGLGVVLGATIGLGYFVWARQAPQAHPQPLLSLEPGQFDCSNPEVVDGDTLRCNGQRVRLAYIDAPEMPGHCRPGRTCTPGDPYAAHDRLSELARGQVLCRQVDTDGYGRTVARCEAGGVDLSCAMVESGNAVERYGTLNC